MTYKLYEKFYKCKLKFNDKYFNKSGVICFYIVVKISNSFQVINDHRRRTFCRLNLKETK